jgi:class III poly(R)-hydroxyalkanoic acid synthase PhaE subunit
MTVKKGSEDDFEAQAQRYWSAWGEALQQGAAQAAPADVPGSGGGAPDWRQAMDWWAQQLPGDASSTTQEAIGRFRNQAGDWLGTMQQVAAGFAGRDTTSEDVARAWREAVEGQGERLMQWTLGAAGGGAAPGVDPLLQEAARLFETWRRDSAPWLDMPAFGLGRNHQTRWQVLARAQQEYQERAQAYAAQLKSAIDQAFKLFESKLAEHEGAGSQLTSARAMFDLWIEAAEEAYSVVALSEEFQHVYGALTNAQMRLRAGIQQEVEQFSERLGMPTRSEMDAAHRRIAELERLLRRMAAGTDPESDDAVRAKSSPKAAGKSKARKAPSPAAAKKPSGRSAKPAKAAPRGKR